MAFKGCPALCIQPDLKAHKYLIDEKRKLEISSFIPSQRIKKKFASQFFSTLKQKGSETKG